MVAPNSAVGVSAPRASGGRVGVVDRRIPDEKPDTGRKGWRKRKRGESYAHQLAWLQSDEGIAAMGDLRHEQIRMLNRLLKRLQKDVPSEPWEVAIWRNRETLPGGMVRCCGCHRMTPPQCVGSSGHCDDCRLSALSLEAMAHIPSSPSGMAIRAAALAGIRLSCQPTHLARETRKQ